MAGIKEDPWFKKGYVPANAEDEDVYVDNEAFSMHEAEQRNSGSSPAIINAFQLIGMSSCLDLSGFFEKEVSMKFRITNPNQCISISTDTKFVHSFSCFFKQVTTSLQNLTQIYAQCGLSNRMSLRER